MASLAGNVPAPIYLDAVPNKWAGLGQGLQSLAQNIGPILQQMRARKALEESQNLPPEEQAQYLMQKLGPEGIEFVKNLTDLRMSQARMAESQAETGRAQAETTRTNLLSQALEFQNAHQGQAFALQQQEGQARIAASQAEIMRARADTERSGLLSQALAFQNAHQGETLALQQQAELSNIKAREAAAAGEGARAAQETSAAQLNEQRMKLLQQQMDQTRQMSGALLQSLSMGPSAPGAAPNGPSPSAPSPRPQSYESAPGQVAPSPAVERISDTGGGTQGPTASPGQGGAAQPPASSQGPSTEALLGLADQLDKGADPTANMPPYKVTMTPQQRMEILAHVSGGTPEELAKAAEAASKAQQPTKVFKKETMPGFSAEFGLYPDGTAHAIPGTMEYNPKPTPEMATRFSEGIQQWYNTNEILKKLMNADPDSSGRDVMGNVGVRNINAWLVDNHLPPIGDNANVRDIRTQAYTAYQHNVIGISQLGAGTRQTQRLIEMYRDAMGNPRDSKDVRNAKLAMSDEIAKIMVKDQVDTLAHAGQRVPPDLRQLYTTMGLSGVSEDKLRQNFLSQYQLVGPSTNGTTDADPPVGMTPRPTLDEIFGGGGARPQ